MDPCVGEVNPRRPSAAALTQSASPSPEPSAGALGALSSATRPLALPQMRRPCHRRRAGSPRTAASRPRPFVHPAARGTALGGCVITAGADSQCLEENAHRWGRGPVESAPRWWGCLRVVWAQTPVFHATCRAESPSPTRTGGSELPQPTRRGAGPRQGGSGPCCSAARPHARKPNTQALSEGIARLLLRASSDPIPTSALPPCASPRAPSGARRPPAPQGEGSASPRHQRAAFRSPSCFSTVTFSSPHRARPVPLRIKIPTKPPQPHQPP